jgi:glycosyltransferase involved in cell wall biosynthesis
VATNTLKDRSKKLLMVCYYYPPTHNSGVERSVKFARYLPEHGWETVVLTTDAHGEADGEDEARAVRTGEFLNVYRRLFNKTFREARKAGKTVPTLPPTTPGRGVVKKIVDLALKWVVIPDIQMGWNAFALKPALRILGAADAIYTTSPNESAHLLGLALKKLTGKPWVVDLRDPWTFESVGKHLRDSRFRMFVERRMERACFGSADAIVINTPQAARRYRAIYPEYAGKMRTITNGFDAGEMARAAGASDLPTPWRDVPEGAFVISHIGEFFRYKGAERTPETILRAFEELLAEGAVSTGECRVIFAGGLPSETLERINALGLEDLIDAPGVVSHFDAMRLMLGSDLLILFDPNEDGRTYVRSKLYEYLGTGKPILGAVPEGASRELLEKTGSGLLVHPDDVEGMKAAIKTSLERRGEPARNPAPVPPEYERKRLAGELAKLLDSLAG